MKYEIWFKIVHFSILLEYLIFNLNDDDSNCNHEDVFILYAQIKRSYFTMERKLSYIRYMSWFAYRLMEEKFILSSCNIYI